MAARRPFWKWRCWKSIGFCLWPPSTWMWNLKLKFQSKLDLCSGNHVVYRQTDRRTDKVNPVHPPSNFVGRGYKNILGGKRLQKAKYLVSKWCLKRIPIVTSILILVYLSQSKTQLVKPKKTTSDIQHRNHTLPKNSPIDCDGVQLHQYWTALPVFVNIYMYIRPITRTRIWECICIDKHILTEFLDGNKYHQEETHRPTHRFWCLFLDLLLISMRGCASTMGVIKLPPYCLSPKLVSQLIHKV